MLCKQITTFSANGLGYPVEKSIPVTREADEARHLESGVINVYPGITYQNIEGFGGAMTESRCLSALQVWMPGDPAARRWRSIFGEDGNGLQDFIRVPIDSCDYLPGGVSGGRRTRSPTLS